jgi:hypothetical protein
VWKVRAWVVQEGRWGYVQHSPKIWWWGGGYEMWRTKCSEGDRKRKRVAKEKNTNPAKKGVGKKKLKNLVTLVLTGFDH